MGAWSESVGRHPSFPHAGGARESRTTGRPSTLRGACAISWTRTAQRRSASPSCPTTYNLSTHAAGSLYVAFEPEEARRFLRKLELYYAPTHASWLQDRVFGNEVDAESESVVAGLNDADRARRAPPRWFVGPSRRCLTCLHPIRRTTRSGAQEARRIVLP